jgi:hypothetical protein
MEDALFEKIDFLINQNQRIMLDITRLQSAVAAETTAEKSAIVLLGQLAQALRSIPTSDPVTQDALNSLAAQIEQNTVDIGNAVAANTIPPADTSSPSDSQ